MTQPPRTPALWYGPASGWEPLPQPRTTFATPPGALGLRPIWLWGSR